MSNVKLDKFYKEMFDDQNFKDSFINLCKKNKDKKPEERFEIALKELIMPYAKSHNYNFTEEEIRSYEAEKLKNLSEEDLENVSGGGIIGASLFLLATALSISSPVATFQVASKAVGAASSAASSIVETIDKSANVKYVKNAIGDAAGVYGVTDAAKKAYNYLTGTKAAPESEASLQSRTGLTAVGDKIDLGEKIKDIKTAGNAALLSGKTDDGLGCSVDTLLGYIKAKTTELGDTTRYDKLQQITLKGFSGVSLGGVSHIPIICTDSNGKVQSVRIPSEDQNGKYNYVYYPETKQMYVAGTNNTYFGGFETPTITQKDLDKIKELGKLETDIDEIKITGWKTNLAVGFRQELKFGENTKDDWHNINDSWGNYHYYSDKAYKGNETYRKNLEKFNNLPFKNSLDDLNGVSMDNEGTLTINFKEGVSKNLKIDNDVITTLKDYYKFRIKQIRPDDPERNFNTNKIRINFISSKPNIEGLPENVELTTAIIEKNYELQNQNQNKSSEVTTKSMENSHKVIKDENQYKFSEVTTESMENGHKVIKDENGSMKALIFGNFKAEKDDGYVYIIPTGTKDPKAEITIKDNELNLIAEKFGIKDIYSKSELKCNWKIVKSGWNILKKITDGSYYHYANQQ